MRIELIQPFINATDAVLSEMLHGPAGVSRVVMEDEAYRRKGVAASVAFHGDIEGRVIFDVESDTARRVASALGQEAAGPLDQVAGETICELANMVVGNAVTLLNDRGHRFKVVPPALHASDKGYASGCESEAVVMCFQTPSGPIYLNVALDYSPQHSSFLAEKTI